MATRFQAALQPTVQEAIETFDIPGFAIIAARDGHTIQRLFVGTDAAGTPLNDDSIFPISSVGKLAVSLAVLRLADTGQLALDDLTSTHKSSLGCQLCRKALRRGGNGPWSR